MESTCLCHQCYREELVYEGRRAAYRKDAAVLADLHSAIAAIDDVIAEGLDEEPLGLMCPKFESIGAQ